MRSAKFHSATWLLHYCLSAIFCVCEGTLTAQEIRTNSKVLAPTPPMGWNSWDSYGLRINEQQFRENVEVWQRN